MWACAHSNLRDLMRNSLHGPSMSFLCEELITRQRHSKCSSRQRLILMPGIWSNQTKRGTPGTGSRRLIRTGSLAIVALLLCWMAPSRASCQTAPTPLTELRFKVPAPVPEDSSSKNDGPVCRYDCRTNYWIISTRQCPQTSRQCCIGPCNFRCYRVGSRRSNKHHSCDWNEFAKSLEPGVPVCFVIHGSFVNWASARQDSHRTYQWLRAAAPDKPLHVVFLTWPSEYLIRILPHVTIATLGKRSAFNGFYLAQLIGRIPPQHPVSLLGHSHGVRTTLAAMHLLGGGRVEGRTLCRKPKYHGHRLRAVLAAAAVDHHWLNPGKRYDRALCPLEALVNLRNRLDPALWIYPLRRPFGHLALSHSGFLRSDRRRLGAANAKLVEFDVSRFVGQGHMWPNYYNRPEIAKALIPYLYFSDESCYPTGSAPAPAEDKVQPKTQTQSPVDFVRE